MQPLRIPYGSINPTTRRTNHFASNKVGPGPLRTVRLPQSDTLREQIPVDRNFYCCIIDAVTMMTMTMVIDPPKL